MPKQYVITIDEHRSITLDATEGGTLVMTVEDPKGIAIVEMPKPDVVALYEVLEDWIKR